MIPDSISAITTEKQNDLFAPLYYETIPDYIKVINVIKQQLPVNLCKRFEEGLVFYKQSNNYRDFLKHVILLYINFLLQTIKETVTDDVEREKTVELFLSLQKTILQMFETTYIALDNIAKNEKSIDVQEISCILLGYATETLKRTCNTKTDKR